MCAAFFIAQVPIASASDTEQYVSFSVPIISSECPDLTCVNFCKYDGTYYLSIRDIAKLARFKMLDENEQGIWLEQGARIVFIGKEDGSLLDCNYIEQGTIPIQYHDGEYMLEGIPMLTYLGATCSVTEKGYLQISTPWITYWEAIMPDYEDYCFDLETLYDGAVDAHIICDIIADLLDISEGGILPAGKNERYESALYEMLEVDMNEYEGVQQLTAWKNTVTRDFISSEAMAAIYQDEFEHQQELAKKKSERQEDEEKTQQSNEDGANFWGIAEELFEKSMDVFWEQERQNGIKNWQNAFSSGNTSKMAEAAAENSETLYRQAYAKAGLEKLSSYQDFLDVVMVTANVIGTANDLMEYDIETRELIKNALSSDVLKNAGYQNLAWNKASDSVSKRLSTDTNILIGSAYEGIRDFAIEEIADKGIPALGSLLTSNANVYYVIVKMSLSLASVAFDDLFKSYSSDLIAIDTNEIHRDVLQILNATEEKARSENYSNPKTLEQLQKLYMLYYRLIISFSDNFATSLKEFGGKNKDKWIANFAGKEGGSYCNYAAAYLYLITNCSVQPISEYSSEIDQCTDLFQKYDPTEEYSESVGISDIAENTSRSAAEIAKRVTGLHCEWAIEGDFDDDGSDEIYALVCNSSSDYSNGQLWHFTSTGNRCMFYIDEADFDMICGIIKKLPDWLSAEIIDTVDNIDEFISDIERRYFK